MTDLTQLTAYESDEEVKLPLYAEGHAVTVGDLIAALQEQKDRLEWLERCERAIQSMADQICSPDTTAEDMVNDILGDKPRRKGRASR